MNPAALQFVSILDYQGRIHEEAHEAQSDQDELIYALMQKGMTERQAEEELFRRLKKRDSPKETEDS